MRERLRKALEAVKDEDLRAGRLGKALGDFWREIRWFGVKAWIAEFWLMKWPWVGRRRFNELIDQNKRQLEMMAHFQGEVKAARLAAIRSARDAFEEGRKAGHGEGMAAAETTLEKVARLSCQSVARAAAVHRHVVNRRGTVMLANDGQAAAIWAAECARTGRELDAALDGFERALRAARLERKENEERGKQN